MPGITRGLDTMSFRMPLGVCAGITPSNFPAMIPLWVRICTHMISNEMHCHIMISVLKRFDMFFVYPQMFPMALICGNTMVLKPSESDPGPCMLLMELFKKAGAPPGVVNVIHGTVPPVNFLCDHPDIQAVSFVGSDVAVRD